MSLAQPPEHAQEQLPVAFPVVTVKFQTSWQLRLRHAAINQPTRCGAHGAELATARRLHSTLGHLAVGMGEDGSGALSAFMSQFESGLQRYDDEAHKRLQSLAEAVAPGVAQRLTRSSTPATVETRARTPLWEASTPTTAQLRPSTAVRDDVGQEPVSPEAEPLPASVQELLAQHARPFTASDYNNSRAPHPSKQSGKGSHQKAHSRTRHDDGGIPMRPANPYPSIPQRRAPSKASKHGLQPVQLPRLVPDRGGARVSIDWGGDPATRQQQMRADYLVYAAGQRYSALDRAAAISVHTRRNSVSSSTGEPASIGQGQHDVHESRRVLDSVRRCNAVCGNACIPHGIQSCAQLNSGEVVDLYGNAGSPLTVEQLRAARRQAEVARQRHAEDERAASYLILDSDSSSDDAELGGGYVTDASGSIGGSTRRGSVHSLAAMSVRTASSRQRDWGASPYRYMATRKTGRRGRVGRRQSGSTSNSAAASVAPSLGYSVASTHTGVAGVVATTKDGAVDPHVLASSTAHVLAMARATMHARTGSDGVRGAEASGNSPLRVQRRTPGLPDACGSSPVLQKVRRKATGAARRRRGKGQRRRQAGADPVSTGQTAKRKPWRARLAARLHKRNHGR